MVFIEVANLAHPGGSITGFTTYEPSMVGKWVEMLKEMAPRVSRLAFLFNPHFRREELLAPPLTRWDSPSGSARTNAIPVRAEGAGPSHPHHTRPPFWSPAFLDPTEAGRSRHRSTQKYGTDKTKAIRQLGCLGCSSTRAAS